MKKGILLGLLLLAPSFLNSTHKNRLKQTVNVVVDDELQKEINQFIGIMKTPLRVFWTSKETRAYYQRIVNEINHKNKNKRMTRAELQEIRNRVLAEQVVQLNRTKMICCNSRLCRVAIHILAGVSMYTLGTYFQLPAESSNFEKMDAASAIDSDFVQGEASGNQLRAIDGFRETASQLAAAAELIALPGVSLYRQDSEKNPVLKFNFAKSNSAEMATLNRLVNQGVLPEGTLGVFADKMAESDDHGVVEAIVYAEPVMHGGYNHCKLASTQQIICTKNNCKLFLEHRVRCVRDPQADL